MWDPGFLTQGMAIRCGIERFPARMSSFSPCVPASCYPEARAWYNSSAPGLHRRQIAILTAAGARDLPPNCHPHRRRCADLVAMSTLSRRPSRPSASPVSNGPPLHRSAPGQQVVPPLTGGVDVEEDFFGNG
jgi:hypothetical protein